MIFVTLGTQKFQLNRLLKQLDKYIEQGQITDKVIAQIGYSDYLPKRYEYIDFLNKTEFDEMIEAADIVIAHSGGLYYSCNKFQQAGYSLSPAC